MTSLFGGGSNNESRFPLFLRGVILSGESDIYYKYHYIERVKSS